MGVVFDTLPTNMGKKQGSAKSAQLGLDADRETDFGKWYIQVITRAELIEYYDISGCYVLRPNAYEIWEEVQRVLNNYIKESGVRNCYFPLLVSQASLTREESHLEGFSPEVAWVTRAGNSELGAPVAIRPTSETIMYPIFARWINSHRDLPLRLNQWSNVVRWEFKDAVPFIRSREFLWQEGHSVFATQEEADAEVLEILDYYQKVYEELLAVPIVPGRKSEKEKFAGADYTTTCEAFIPHNGRAVQGATSHCLGRTFSCKEMFNITYQTDDKETMYPIQNSWGFTTRSIGVAIMLHSDNTGMILPPRVAPIQIAIIPIHFKGKIEMVNEKAQWLHQLLKSSGLRVTLDDRPYNPGWKQNDHELHGIPLRVELGPRDVENSTVVVARRDKPGKENKVSLTLDESLPQALKDMLEDVHANLFQRAKELCDKQTVDVEKWEDFVPALNNKCRVLAPWCEQVSCENDIKKRSKEESEAGDAEESASTLTGAAKSLCIPFSQREIPEGTICFAGCGSAAKSWTLFGRSY